MTVGLIRRGFADLADGQLHYAQCGAANARPIVLLHQTPRSWAEYRWVLPILGVRYRAIAIDTIGFGDSARPDWPASIERWAAVAAEFLEALGIERAHVVGHHTGGVIAVELAAAYPERVDRLVLSSTPFTDEPFRRARAASGSPVDAVVTSEDGAHLAALWRQRQPYYPPGRPELLNAFVLDALRVIDRVEDGHRAVGAYRMEDRIGLVGHPTLVIRAAADPFARDHAAPLCAKLSNARLVELDGGVPLPEQLPEAFAQAVLDFLGSAEA